ncbi:MAG: NADH-quinone oxidoreductase subunit L [Chitinophagaceae bacterium]
MQKPRFWNLEQAVMNGTFDMGYLTTIAICFFIGATGKSAQIPLFTWLPDAMAGPTPVSALIHAATMVTAGIYMITRSHFIYSFTPHAQQVILLIGAATAFVAATIATQQNDIKKVLAYSTVSQLGFMFMALGVGAYVAAVFHVITHAFFKALLFLGSGSVIHAVHDEQDIRKMGGLKKYMKTTYFTFLIGCIAIAGLPPLSGFFSKDEIMMHVFTHTEYGKLFWIVGMLAAFMTAYYMFRLLFLTFHGKYRGEGTPHESPSLMTIPLVVLAILSIVGGLIGIPKVLGGQHALKHFLESVLLRTAGLKLSEMHLSETSEYILMAVAVCIALAGMAYAYISTKEFKAESNAKGIQKLFADKWYFDELYNQIISKPLIKLSAWSNQFIEKLGIDGLVNGVGKTIVQGSTKFRLLQNGIVGFYLFMIVLGVIILFVIQLWYNKI